MTIRTMKNKNSGSTFKVHVSILLFFFIIFFTDCCTDFIPALEADIPSSLRTGQPLCVVHYRNDGSCRLSENTRSYRQHKCTISNPSWSDLSRYQQIKEPKNFAWYKKKKNQTKRMKLTKMIPSFCTPLRGNPMDYSWRKH